MELKFAQDYLVRIFVVDRIMWLEYWLTHDCVAVVLFQPRIVWLKYRLTHDFVVVVLFQTEESEETQACVVGILVDPGLCGGSTV